MPDNQGLSHLSDHFLIVAVVLYSLAVIAFAADFAFGRRSPVVTRAKAEVPDLVPAGVAAGEVEGGAAQSGTAHDAAGPDASGVGPDGTRPDGTRPDGTRPDCTRPDGTRP
ncbi:MAG: hypothetical protein ACLP5E_29290, partial [Streptosporangiaceae bacterium]